MTKDVKKGIFAEFPFKYFLEWVSEWVLFRESIYDDAQKLIRENCFKILFLKKVSRFEILCWFLMEIQLVGKSCLHPKPKRARVTKN